MTVCWQRQKHWFDTVSLWYDTISESRYQQLYEHTDKSFWNFHILQLYRSHSCVWGDGWEPPWIPCGDVSWFPGGADISFLNYTQYRIQLIFTTHKDNIFWIIGSYFSASSPNTCKYLLAHPYPYKISYHCQIPVTLPNYSVTTWKTTILDDAKHDILANSKMCVITVFLIAELQSISFL